MKSFLAYLRLLVVAVALSAPMIACSEKPAPAPAVEPMDEEAGMDTPEPIAPETTPAA